MTGLPFVNHGHRDGPHRRPSPFSSPKLPPIILRFIHRTFGSDDDLHIDCIQSSSIRILEELSHLEQMDVIDQFKRRFNKNKTAFREICVKIWTKNRAAHKPKLEDRARVNLFRPSSKRPLVELCGIHVSSVIADTLSLLFTRGSGLHLSVIDRSIEKRLNQLSDHDGTSSIPTRSEYETRSVSDSWILFKAHDHISYKFSLSLCSLLYAECINLWKCDHHKIT